MFDIMYLYRSIILSFFTCWTRFGAQKLISNRKYRFRDASSNFTDERVNINLNKLFDFHYLKLISAFNVLKLDPLILPNFDESVVDNWVSFFDRRVPFTAFASNFFCWFEYIQNFHFLVGSNNSFDSYQWKLETTFQVPSRWWYDRFTHNWYGKSEINHDTRMECFRGKK